MLDAGQLMARTGTLAESPGGAFSAFEILVEKATFMVRLWGITRTGERKQLYECKAGLGSEEYPTPKGSFYIVRIFDNHPWWIPPPDREWAVGMAPSKTVYGGHMMPFFKKNPVRGVRQGDTADQGLDKIAGLMEVVDSGTYRIHGTDSPWSVGSRQSHGCVRLKNQSVKELADTLKMYVGTTSRGSTVNGEYVDLLKPVKLTLF